MKYIRLVDGDDQFSVNTQSLEELVHLKDSGSHRLFRIHLAVYLLLYNHYNHMSGQIANTQQTFYQCLFV